MEKEKQIEEMAEAIYKSGVAIEGTDIAFGLYDTDTHFHRMAAKLYKAGYGNVKEALKECAKKVKAAEHRAEVAEQALKITASELEKARGYSEREAVTLAGEIYIPEVINQAEKDLSEV